MQSWTTNYVSVRVFDNAGSSAGVTDVFYIKKDTSAPSVTDNQSGDDAWRRFGGTAYNVDFADSGAGLNGAKYEAWTGPGRTGTQKIALTSVPDVVGDSFTGDWTVDFTLLAQGTNYISVEAYDALGSTASSSPSVSQASFSALAEKPYYWKARALDNAGNYSAYSSTRSFTVDLTTPTVADLQDNATHYLTANTGLYNVNFDDLGGSLLEKVQVKIMTGSAQTGTLITDWADNITGINSSLYSSDWSLAAGHWSLLLPGTNYISVRAYDNGGSYADLTDSFNVLKDTQNPSGTAVPPAYAGALNFNVAYSSSDSGLAGVGYVKLYYTFDTVSPYTWTQFSATFSASPIAFNAPQSGTVGFRIIAYDRAGNTDEAAPPLAATAPEDSTVIDLSAPTVTDNQAGDDTWRNSAGTVYNIDFSASGASLLDTAQYKITSDPGQTGALLKDWTDIAAGINSANYTTDWQADFAALKSSFNYVSVRVWNAAGTTTTANDVFYVKKDTSAPTVTDNQAGDDTWRAVGGTLYNVDFQDPLSLLANVQYSASPAAGAASGELVPWTNIAYGISAENYTTDWAVDFAALNSGATNYISVRGYDLAGNMSISTDIFHVLKDTVPAVITDNQSGDAVWRNSNSGVYNIDFADSGGSLLSAFQVRASSGPGQTGTPAFDWSDQAANINSASYTSDWSLAAGNWSLLLPGTNYISVRTWDFAGTTVTLNDAFYILKDAAGPAITDNQAGDDAWRAYADALYNVDFNDTLSGLSSLYAKVHSEPAQAGVLLADWALTAPLFTAMAEGQNYVTLKVYDGVGNYSTLADAFYVKKDITGPAITDNQSGDAVWRSTYSGVVYNVDFADSLSLLSRFTVRASSGPGYSGTQALDWTDNTTGINAASYTSDWSLATGNWSLLLPGTNYISVRAYDQAGASTTLADAFYVLKDTSAPSAITNLSANTGSEGEITLSWIASGDDGSSGTAYAYIVKVSSTEAINAGNFDSAQTYAQTWPPAAAGLTENSSLTGLQADTLYYVALKVQDKAGSLSAISNLPSAITGADVAAPGTIALSAATGAFEGQVDLSWTAVGDNGVAVGTATTYLARYRTDQAITTLALWDGAQIYTQSWQPLGAGEAEVKTISGLVPGTIYYWAVRAVDEVNNTGALSNSPSASAQVAGAVGGMLQFGVSTAYDVPYFRKWSPPDFGAAQSGVETDALGNSLIRHAVVKASPLRNEKISGLLSSDGVLQIQRYNGVTDIWTNEWSTTTIGATNSAYRGFDIAYERLSGRAMVLYSGAAAGDLYYNIWDGNSWTGAVTLTTGTANASLWVRLEAKPNSDQLTAAFSKATDLELYAIHWTSIAWTNGYQIAASVGATAKQNFDIAWESSGGECIVVWTDNVTLGKAFTTKWDGSVWSAYTTTTFAFGGANGVPQWLRLVSNPKSGSAYADYIVAASVDGAGDWNSSIWTGSDWAYPATENTAVRNAANQARTIDAAWESNGNEFIVVTASATNFGVRYSSWVSGAWQTTLAASPSVGAWTGLVNGVQLEADPNTDSIILNAASASSDLRTANWNGATFSLGVTHTAAISANAYMPFNFALHRHDTSAPTVADNQSGDDAWRNANTGVYDVDANDTGGSGLRELQVKVYTGAGQTGTLVMDWAAQVSTAGVNSYTLNWALAASAWTALREGVNYVSVRAMDGALNTTVNPIVDAFYVKKDTTVPSVPSLVSPADNAAVNTQSPAFDWSDSSDGTSGMANYELEVSTSDDFGVLSYSSAPAASGASASGLASGKYFWRVRAKDAASNYSLYSSTFAVFTDTAPPVITNGQSGDDVWRNSSGTVFNFAVSAAKFVGSLPPHGVNVVIYRQLLRSALSIGANWQEAAGGLSDADFTHSANIAKKEARETIYWLKIMKELKVGEPADLNALYTESCELVLILTSIVKKIQNKRRPVGSKTILILFLSFILNPLAFPPPRIGRCSGGTPRAQVTAQSRLTRRSHRPGSSRCRATFSPAPWSMTASFISAPAPAAFTR
ncbi:MAG: four helix bundle protein [Elusimicrobia bacterium]|nr:four helix bundle protein [Elusimicrobiota bacterium]